MSHSKLFIEPPIIAHRGASAYAPENTVAAFKKAKALGLNWVEFDVMLAACGEVIVIHDETLDRTTSGKGSVCEYPYSYLKTLDAGSWFNPEFSQQCIPTLIEVMQLLSQLKLSANVEIKSIAGQEALTAKSVVNILKNFQPVLISSFSPTILQEVNQFATHHWLGYLMHEWQADWHDQCKALNCSAVDVNHEILTADRVREIKNQDYFLTSYTVNDTELAKKLFTMGVDAIFSDVPQSLLDAYILTG